MNIPVFFVQSSLSITSQSIFWWHKLTEIPMNVQSYLRARVLEMEWVRWRDRTMDPGQTSMCGCQWTSFYVGHSRCHQTEVQMAAPAQHLWQSHLWKHPQLNQFRKASFKMTTSLSVTRIHCDDKTVHNINTTKYLIAILSF